MTSRLIHTSNYGALPDDEVSHAYCGVSVTNENHAVLETDVTCIECLEESLKIHGWHHSLTYGIVRERLLYIHALKQFDKDLKKELS